MAAPILDLLGQRFGRLTALSHTRNNRGISAWRCRCDCGAERIVVTADLRSGNPKSCGCLSREMSRDRLKNRTGEKSHSWKGGRILTRRLRMQTPAYRIPAYLRTRLVGALRGKNKSTGTLKLLGCSVEFLRVHLEKQFVPGMTWENYGPVWHIDHILPCAAFHLQHSEEQEICFHWTNLQPLFAADNRSKGDKII